MSELSLARVALYIAPSDRHGCYYREAIQHAGVIHEELTSLDAEGLEEFDCLLLCGDGSLTEDQLSTIREWTVGDKSVVCSGSAWGLEGPLGIEPVRDGIYPSSDLVGPAKNHAPLWPEGAASARFFGGAFASSAGATVYSETSGGYVGASQNGSMFFVAPNVGKTIAALQMGRSVETDGIGPNDGSARLDDGIHRAEDGSVLSFDQDRIQGSEEPSVFFGVPHADVIKELWIRTVLQACLRTGRSPAVLWHWPDNATGAAALTVECEEFSSDHVATLTKQMTMFGARAAWFVGLPGYPLDVYRILLKSRHEIGLLFLADEHIGWTEERLRIQQLALMRSTSLGAIVSSRPISGRWKGLTAFYDLGESAGIKLSASKGGRQPGTSGFLFGTSHPFHPYRRDGQPYRLLELPYVAFSPGLGTSIEIVDQAIAQVILRAGCVHVTLRSELAATPRGVAGLRQFLANSKQAHLVFMTPEEIFEFERGRRSIQITSETEESKCAIRLTASTDIENLSLLVAGKGVDCRSAVRTKITTLKRYGIDFASVTFDLSAKCRAELFLSRTEETSQAA